MKTVINYTDSRKAQDGFRFLNRNADFWAGEVEKADFFSVDDKQKEIITAYEARGIGRFPADKPKPKRTVKKAVKK